MDHVSWMTHGFYISFYQHSMHGEGDTVLAATLILYFERLLTICLNIGSPQLIVRLVTKPQTAQIESGWLVSCIGIIIILLPFTTPRLVTEIRFSIITRVDA